VSITAFSISASANESSTFNVSMLFSLFSVERQLLMKKKETAKQKKDTSVAFFFFFAPH
jgi:hypothetical protein